ncbi:hypothetical protein Trydic_g8730 [Trypoxylus dichotomus]
MWGVKSCRQPKKGTIKSAVPQRPAVGPALFIIYIGDFSRHEDHEVFNAICADNIAIVATSRDANIVAGLVQVHLRNIIVARTEVDWSDNDNEPTVFYPIQPLTQPQKEHNIVQDTHWANPNLFQRRLTLHVSYTNTLAALRTLSCGDYLKEFLDKLNRKSLQKAFSSDSPTV